MIAKSRLPGDCLFSMDPRMRRTSSHGNARGGRWDTRNRGPITPLARSAGSLPVVWRKRRKVRSELHVSAMVLVESLAAVLLTKTSTSFKPVCSIGLLRRRSSVRNALAVSMSRRRVRTDTPQWAVRYRRYCSSNGGKGGASLLIRHGGGATPSARKAQDHACRALCATPLLLGALRRFPRLGPP